MRYPEFLKENGTIGFVAPSFGAATEPYHSAFNNALKTFRAMGYSVKTGPNCYASDGVGISSTPENCGREINEAMTDADSDVLISCGGGELMCEILDFVDFGRIAQAPPKWFMGYSDNTNLTFLLPTLCDTAAIYGPCAGTFGMEPWHISVQDALDLLRGKKLTAHSYERWEREGFKTEENPLVPYNTTEPVELKPYGSDAAAGNGFSGGRNREEIRFRGRLLGGCTDCLVNLTGTKYDRAREFSEKYAQDGIIWFLESCDLNVFSIRRAMWQMKHAGWFSHVKGFLIGRPLCFGQEMMGLDQYAAVWEPLKEFGVPVIMDVDLGHLPPQMPLICGSMADVALHRTKEQPEWKLEIAMEPE